MHRSIFVLSISSLILTFCTSDMQESTGAKRSPASQNQSQGTYPPGGVAHGGQNAQGVSYGPANTTVPSNAGTVSKGAGNPGVQLTSGQVQELIQQDLATAPGNQNDLIYIRIDHLAQPGQAGDTMDIYRQGITKILNSTSANTQIVNPVPINEEATVFRANTQDYGWKNKRDVMQELSKDTYAADHMATMNGATIMEGDWLVWAASRPEIYNRIMLIPWGEVQLEDCNGVDHNDGSQIYLGVPESIVAVNGRFLERSTIKRKDGSTGYFWRTYDYAYPDEFTSNFGNPELDFESFRVPYQNGIGSVIAGEFIYQLPNGLQAYALFGFGSQRRLDAEKYVARDPRRQDNIVLNGESCFGCHGSGLNRGEDVYKDQVKPHANAAQWSAIQQKFPDQEVLDQIFREDQASYAQAAQQLSYSNVSAESITATVARFLQQNNYTDYREKTAGALGDASNGLNLTKCL